VSEDILQALPLGFVVSLHLLLECIKDTESAFDERRHSRGNPTTFVLSATGEGRRRPKGGSPSS